LIFSSFDYFHFFFFLPSSLDYFFIDAFIISLIFLIIKVVGG